MFSRNLSKALLKKGIYLVEQHKSIAIYYFYNFLIDVVTCVSSFKYTSSASITHKLKEFSIEGLDQEPEAPIVKTPIPGPKSLEMTADLDKIQVNCILIEQNFNNKSLKKF